jgi:hypothetical protein
MVDEDAAMSYAGAGEGPGSQPDPIEEGTETRQGPFVSEEDGDEGERPEDDSGQGGDAPPEGEEGEGVETGRAAGQKPPTVAELAARVQEKERQAHGLTIALQRARQHARILEQRFYAVIDKAMQHTAGAGGAEGGEGAEGEGALEVDPNDPVGRLEAGIAQVNERLDRQEQAQADAHDQEAVDDAIAWVRDDLQSTTAAVPDFPEAHGVVEEHARNSIWGQLRLQYPQADEYALQEAVERMYIQQAARIQVACREAGKSYGAVVLEVARRLGWQGGGKVASPARRAPAGRPSPLAAERAARGGGPSLSHVASTTPRRQPVALDVLNMDDNDFDKFLDSGEIDFKALAAELASGGRR